MGKIHTFQSFIELIRPHQFTKNLFVCLPAFFAFQITDPALMVNIAAAFIAFSMMAGAVYIINDLSDRNEDLHHPEKKLRPIASGRISVRAAFAGIAILVIAASLLSYALSVVTFLLITGYLALNIIYSIKLKHIPVIDICLISSGFIIRLLVGSEVAHVPLSPWIIVLTFLLALFLALAKRRDDVLLYLNTDRMPRLSVDGYNLKFIDSAMVMTASIVVLAYILWTFSTGIADKLEENNLYLTSVFVLLGMMRYMHITFVQEKSGNPSMVLLQDRFLQLVLIGWVGSLIWILYR